MIGLAKRVISVILSILIFLFAILSLTTSMFKFVVGDFDGIKNNVLTDSYIDALYSDVNDDVDGECVILEVEAETVMSYITKDNLRDFAEKLFKNQYEVVFQGAKIDNMRYELDGLKADIFNELEAFAQNQGIVDEDISLSATQTYNVIMDSVNDTINYFTNEDLNKASVVSHIPGLSFLSGVGFYIFAALFVICCVLKVLVAKSFGLARTFYYACFMSWLASAIFFFPLLILKIANIPSKIMIAYGGFRIWSQNLVNAILNPSFTISLIVFIVFTLGFLAFFVFTLVNLSKRIKAESSNAQESQEEDL